jgi:hypothetical protein
MQTWLVHIRSPRLRKRELGWLGFAVFQLLVGGTVLAALVHSLFVGELLWELANSAAAEMPPPYVLSDYTRSYWLSAISYRS